MLKDFVIDFKLSQLINENVTIPKICEYIDISVFKYKMDNVEKNTLNIKRDKNGNIISMQIFLDDIEGIKEIKHNILNKMDLGKINVIEEKANRTTPYKLSLINSIGLIINPTSKEVYKTLCTHNIEDQFDSYFLINNF